MKALNRFSTLVIAAGLLTACGGDSSSSSPPVLPPGPVVSETLSFELSVTNLTLAQPLSPPAVFLHSSGYGAFVDGDSASVALEVLAEGGDRTDLVTEVTNSGTLLASYDDANPVGPMSIGPTVTLEIPSDEADDVRLTAVTMLVHTNDAFTGLNAVDVTGMAVGESRVFSTPTWDAGTEANSENAASMPGPDFGGEGFNPTRDEAIDRVRFHQGVVTSASLESGDPNSALGDQHRFDNPTGRIRITRVQ
ncbi:MAG: spondin domain-containing protein [Pseudomonadota bacterium]